MDLKIVVDTNCQEIKTSATAGGPSLFISPGNTVVIGPSAAGKSFLLEELASAIRAEQSAQRA
jgi:ABC-type iron transport system FetAB ATPase subunit